MDNVRVRTAEELEKKYNLPELFKKLKNAETIANQIIHLQNELNDMIMTLIINLGDTVQSEVSLWFYSGTPTLSNEPYTDWITPSEHYDDFYYDQSTGYVYKFTSNGWEQQYDTNLINALALTNAELDVSLDHERKVYLSQPSPPYSSGDWWILENGTLMICQIGKISGDYEENDFIVSSKYTTTVATKQDNTLTVLKGTVQEITEDYVKFTDLSTGGSSTIAGDNITTGKIRSSNYVSGTSGTELDLSNGKITMPNITLDNDGMKLSNGAKVAGSNGLMNTYVFEIKTKTQKEGFLGWDFQYQDKMALYSTFAIPEGLSITNARIQLYHSPVFFMNTSPDPPYTPYNVCIGYSRSIKAYKATNIGSRQIEAFILGEYDADSNTTYTDTGLTWYDENGTSKGAAWTPSTPSSLSYDMEQVISSDISSLFKSGGNTVPGTYEIKIETSESAGAGWSDDDYNKRTGWCYGQIIIDGYMTYE